MASEALAVSARSPREGALVALGVMIADAASRPNVSGIGKDQAVRFETIGDFQVLSVNRCRPPLGR